jgi:hypothetical protein
MRPTDFGREGAPKTVKRLHTGGPDRTGPGPSDCRGATPSGPAEPDPPEPSAPVVERVMSVGFRASAAEAQPGGSDRPAGGNVRQSLLLASSRFGSHTCN